MKIKAFILTFNEADIIEFTINHYQKYCSEIHIYDNYSTDKTRDIATKLGGVVHLFGKEGLLDDREYLKVKNNCWKDHCDSDFVIVCDADELIEPVANMSIIEALYCGELFRCIGYNIYSEVLPHALYKLDLIGFRDPMFDKPSIFSPSHLREINYGYGCHGARPIAKTNNVRINTTNFNLYHYSYVGGVERKIN